MWVGDFQLPSAVWLGGLFNPQSFLTSIMQTTARKNEWPLDKMCLSIDVLKKTREELAGAPREGSYIYGLYMEGARWDSNLGQIAESKLKELTPLMPIVGMGPHRSERTISSALRGLLPWLGNVTATPLTMTHGPQTSLSSSSARIRPITIVLQVVATAAS